jgi:hypothetical protein
MSISQLTYLRVEIPESVVSERVAVSLLILLIGRIRRRLFLLSKYWWNMTAEEVTTCEVMNLLRNCIRDHLYKGLDFLVECSSLRNIG